MEITRRALLAGLGSLPMVRLAHGQTAHRLTILHINDIHSRHEPVDARALGCKPGREADCYGGTPRLATAIFADRDAARAAGREVIQLDAGDQFQGSLFYTAWKGEVELEVAHAFGTEAMAVGNHEFDNGPKTLARFVRSARFPVISANIDASAEPALAGLLRPHALFERAGLKIGVVGATTQQTAVTSSAGPHVVFTDPQEALAREAAALRAQGAQLVIALSHLGVDLDRDFAGNIQGIGVFIGGHTHTLLSDSEAGAAGPAHAILAGKAGSAVVVQAACYARYYGRLDLDLDADGRILAVGGDTRHVGLELPEEPGVAAIVARYAAQLDTVRKRVVGHAATATDIDGCRVAECSFGDFLTDAMLAATPQADVALFNGGGMRTGLPAGDITIGDVLTALPFGNTLATVQVTGADLRAALANGVARAGYGAFPQVAGMRYRWSPAAPADRRLGQVDIRRKDGSFAPLDPNRLYTLATNNFVRTGGDGYVVLRDNGRDAYDTGPGIDEILQRALAHGGEIGAQAGGRIIPE
jgi:5'-nucleotidase / UDP-sugar diphosphatase